MVHQTTHHRYDRGIYWGDEDVADSGVAPYKFGHSARTDSRPEDPVPLFLSDYDGEPDPSEYMARLRKDRRFSVSSRILAGLLAPAAAPPAAAVPVTAPLVAAPPARKLDPDELATFLTRAKSLLAAGDIPSARLLLERAADAQDAGAALMLARTYDPDVLGTQDTRNITPDPAMARAWYQKAAQLGSTDAQRRLTQLQN